MKRINSISRVVNGEELICEWCPDDTCVNYWRVIVFDKVHIICNCCYDHLRPIDELESEAQK